MRLFILVVVVLYCISVLSGIVASLTASKQERAELVFNTVAALGIATWGIYLLANPQE